jgi:threonine aldolase
MKTPSPLPKRQFASDNYAGIAPEAWAALERANRGHARAYGDDEWTAAACDRVRELFETDCEVFFVFNGTAANSLALATLCQPYHSVICYELAHLETDECGAPEFFSNGTKVLLAGGSEGKLAPEHVAELATRRSDIHYPKPKALSLTQATELGTVYRVDELAELAEVAKRFDLRVHMDGARFANAVASLSLAPKEISWQAGVDVLCFGGTKLGMPVGEMVVFFDHALASEFDYRCKQAGQLASKMRFLAAPWLGMLEGDTWLDHARHANAQAQRLAEQLAAIPGLDLLTPCEANSVFVELPASVARGLEERGWFFYSFIGEGGVRLMTAWDTQSADVEALVADVAELMANPPARP